MATRASILAATVWEEEYALFRQLQTHWLKGRT